MQVIIFISQVVSVIIQVTNVIREIENVIKHHNFICCNTSPYYPVFLFSYYNLFNLITLQITIVELNIFLTQMIYTTDNFQRPLCYISDTFFDNSLSNIKLIVYQVQGNYKHFHNFVAHGNAIPSENDVYRQTFLFVSSQPLIPQKYHWYHWYQNKNRETNM